MALGGVLVAVALDAHHRVVLGGEGPIHQRPAALGAEEAFAVPVAVLVGQILHSQSQQRTLYMSVRREIMTTRVLVRLTYLAG